MLDWSGVAWAQLLTELRKDADGTVHARGPDELRRFTLAAREILPRLLDEVERTRALLRRIEWGSEGESSCPACGGEEPVFDEEKELDAGSWQPRPYYTPAGHKPGCDLAALIGGEDSGPTSEELGLRAYDLEYPGKPRGGEG
jgi:hypothetical protein